MKKILLVFGTRPEAIKMAPVVNVFKSEPSIDVKVCVTGQHREMLDQVLTIFDIQPDYDLDLMRKNQDLYDVTVRVLVGMREVLEQYKPDMVLVHGDTTTTFATSLAAFYKQIKVGHVEAGLRTNNIYSPWPEEVNRQGTGILANFHFAPTMESKCNLIQENKNEESILVTGNTIIDALFWVLEKIKKDRVFKREVIQNIERQYHQRSDKRFILVTGHRRENFGDGFRNICQALKLIAENNPDIDIVYPVHLNPNVRCIVEEMLSQTANIKLTKPLPYENFIYLMNESYFVITDSGGIQEEAPSLGKPVLVLRDTTERPEAIDAGTVRLVGTDKNKIIEEAEKLLNNVDEYQKMSNASNPYGDGKASQKILDFIKRHLNEKI